VGQTIKILAASVITITDSTNVRLRGSSNFDMVAGDSLTLHMFNDQFWEETARSTTRDNAKASTNATSRDTTATLADDTYLINYLLDAATIYAVEGFLFASSASSTPDIKFALSTDNAFQNAVWSWTNVNTATTISGDTSDPTSAVLCALVAGLNHGVSINGFVSTHATLASNVDFQWAQNTSDATATTLGGGSWLKFTKMT